MIRSAIAIVLWCAVALYRAVLPAAETGPWNLPILQQTPAAEWSTADGGVQEVRYVGETFQGKPTTIFAYLARPTEGAGPFPAMVLAHGGGGKAFRDWALHWAKHGYVALAMDLAGNGSSGRLPDGGPDQGDDLKFRDFSGDAVKDMWTYHAVAAVIRGHSLLLSRAEVDPHKTALTGISWGGYLTCIVAGLDHRFKAAVPVYGCGFLYEDSYWLSPQFSKMDDARRQRWIDAFDPSRYLGGATCPMLFVNGTNDFAYPLGSYRKSYELVKTPKQLSVKINLPHGHIWTMREVDTFIDATLIGGKPLPALGAPVIADGRLSAALTSVVPVTKVELCYTIDGGPWQKRAWKTMVGDVTPSAVAATLPTERPLVGYLLVTDERGLCVSTPHIDLPPAAK